jgi:hypothetical protein
MIGISTRTLTKFRNASRCCESSRRKRKLRLRVHRSHHIAYRRFLTTASTCADARVMFMSSRVYGSDYFPLVFSPIAKTRRILFATGRSAAAMNPQRSISHVERAAHHNRVSSVAGIIIPNND